MWNFVFFDKITTVIIIQLGSKHVKPFHSKIIDADISKMTVGWDF